VQRILAENVPVCISPRRGRTRRHSTRVINVTPSVLRPPFLWNADLLAVSGDTNTSN
jgi:hypothetical protein